MNVMVVPGQRLSNRQINNMYLTILQALNSEQWKTRGRVECHCGQPALYTCGQCELPDLCRMCMVEAHLGSPLHKIREWSERAQSYACVSLRELGLRVALGHSGAPCPHPHPRRMDAITMTGIETLAVDFCGCERATNDGDQIKARGWWPLCGNYLSAIPLAVLRQIADRDEGEDLDAEQFDEESESSDAESEAAESSTSE
ncbi:hypothetical protein C8F04DRAFT_1269940 [Mycena alexandri]|uniref:CxC2-like cysteine cluster KDZ transposase-associated domain-containing protein n=1 Tax=Mycena alexandri TaxID=1745969 RepID=A0AAD6WRV4_9AGAR|nr:hypothetical protein C8F04DRAFT_1269940 [Mycena alexandri]